MSNYTCLNMKERCLITTFLSMKTKVDDIALRTGRHRSTIYRELKRNTEKGQRYMPGLANELAKNRHPHPPNKIDTLPTLNKFILSGLSNNWSPEQISGRMRQEKKDFYACPESIYRYIYQKKNSSLRQLLQRKKPYRSFKKARKARNKVQLSFRNIAFRTEDADLRNALGHWEGDTIHFPVGQKSCVTTLVERKSRFVCLRKNKNKTASTVITGCRAPRETFWDIQVNQNVLGGATAILMPRTSSSKNCWNMQFFSRMTRRRISYSLRDYAATAGLQTRQRLIGAASMSAADGIYHVIKASPLKIWDSLTFDQGPEFMEYPRLEQKTKCRIYFCDPRSPWQRGSNENTNGRLRRYLPKKHSIDETSQDDLDRIAALVNNTPRKCLGYETPREVFIQVWKTFCRAAL